MRAVVMEEFCVPPVVREVPEPVAPPGGAVIEVDATGVCRSDWHTWQGHDTAVKLPHVAGPQLAGRIAPPGDRVPRWGPGPPAPAPFSCPCGPVAHGPPGRPPIRGPQ